MSYKLIDQNTELVFLFQKLPTGNLVYVKFEFKKQSGGWNVRVGREQSEIEFFFNSREQPSKTDAEYYLTIFLSHLEKAK